MVEFIWLEFNWLEFCLLEFIWLELPVVVESLRVALQIDQDMRLDLNLK